MQFPYCDYCYVFGILSKISLLKTMLHNHLSDRVLGNCSSTSVRSLCTFWILNLRLTILSNFFSDFCRTGQGSGDTGNENNGSVWTSWSGWSTCSKSCDEGRQFRNRTCLSPSQCTDSERHEEQACNSHKCTGKYNPISVNILYFAFTTQPNTLKGWGRAQETF